MKKCILTLFTLALLLIYPENARADAFISDYDIYYQAQVDGVIKVTQNITISNQLSNIYASQYSLTLTDLQVENIKAEDSSKTLPIEISREGNKNTITIKFPEPSVGAQNKQIFKITYDVLNLAKKKGLIWEIGIPKLTNAAQINGYRLTLEIPDDFGVPSSIKPPPYETKKLSNSTLYLFSKEQTINSGINANFGSFQVFDFTINYQIENQNAQPMEYSIALPPDGLYQKIFYRLIKPLPDNVQIDADGNWLAVYKLKAREKLDIDTQGKVCLFSEPQSKSVYVLTNFDSYLRPALYWEADNPEIKQIAQELKTPRRIYDYVLKTLAYDYNRIGEGAERLGAVKALKNPTSALCMEFTDLFIALARAAGIPAREVNGFAYTANSKIQTLETNKDILHSWPEYYDFTRQIWIPIDPTWGETTEGVDYFSKMDVSHFAFVIHGQDSVLPYPAGSYRDPNQEGKGISVVFGNYEEEPAPDIEITAHLPKKIFFSRNYLGKIQLKNHGGAAVYNSIVKISTEDYLVKPAETVISLLPPKGYQEVEFTIKLTPKIYFGKSRVSVTVLGQTKIFQIDNFSFFDIALPLVLSISLGLALFFLTKIKIFGRNKL